MGNVLKLGQGASCQVTRLGGVAKQGDKIPLSGHFIVEHLRMNHATGLREKIGEYRPDNGITNQGKNYLLNILANALAINTTWYLGLIDGAGESLSADDVYDEINGTNGWDEFGGYTDPANADSGVTRPVWNPDNSTAQQLINASVVVFDITGTGLIHGLMVANGADADTKGDDTTGTNILWSTAPFSGGEVSVVNLDQLKTTYFINA